MHAEGKWLASSAPGEGSATRCLFQNGPTIPKSVHLGTKPGAGRFELPAERGRTPKPPLPRVQTAGTGWLVGMPPLTRTRPDALELAKAKTEHDEAVRQLELA